MNRPRARLLVVDDNEAGRYLKSRILAKEGWEVDQAADGQTALHRASSDPFDLIVLDVKLPDILGTDVCKRLKREKPGILILQTSATFVDPQHRVKGLDSGADAYLTEPVEATEFVATVRALLRAKEAEEKLRAADAQLAAIARSCPDAIIGYSRDGRIECWNAGAEKLFGYLEFEAIGQNLGLLASADSPDAPRDIFDRAIGGETVTVEAVQRRKDGARVTVLISAGPVRIDDKIVGVSAFMHDITNRRQAEDALRASEERFRSTFENAAVGIAHVASDGAWLRVNRRLCEIVDYPAAELQAKTFQDMTHPDDLAADLAQVERMLAGEIDVYGLEKRYLRKDGSVVWANLTVSCVRTAGGAVDYFISVVEDISARKQAEDERENFGQLVEHSRDFIAMADLDGRVTYMNRAGRQMIGLATDRELPDLHFSEYIAPDSLPYFRDEFIRSALASGYAEGEMRFRHLQTGALIDLSRATFTLSDRFGKPKLLATVARDVTDSKRAEAALRASEGAARCALEELNSIYVYAPVGLCVLSTDLRYLRINERLAEINGIPSDAHVGRTVHEIVPTLADQISANVDKIVRTGEPVLNVEFEGETPAQPGMKRSWLEHWAPYKDEGGRIVAINVVVEEITERKQHEEHLQVIMRELAHRSKNLLAVVQAIVRQTAQHAEGVDAFISQLDSRVGALSHAHDLLIEQNWQGAVLNDLVAGQLRPFVDRQEGRVMVSGPPLMIGPQATQHLVLAFHELATNSSKYGAFSVPGGTVAVDWNTGSGDGGRKTFWLRWAETGGPVVRAPTRRGFGTLVLERLAAAGLNGRAELDYAPDGLKWTLTSDNASFCREENG